MLVGHPFCFFGNRSGSFCFCWRQVSWPVVKFLPRRTCTCSWTVLILVLDGLSVVPSRHPLERDEVVTEWPPWPWLGPLESYLFGLRQAGLAPKVAKSQQSSPKNGAFLDGGPTGFSMIPFPSMATTSGCRGTQFHRGFIGLAAHVASFFFFSEGHLNRSFRSFTWPHFDLSRW